MERRIFGTPVVSGLAVAPVEPFGTVSFEETPDNGTFGIEENLKRFRDAADATEREIRSSVPSTAGSPEADIADVHVMMLRDPEFVGGIEREIRSGTCAENAVVRTARSIAEQFRSIPDPYLSERSSDIEDVGFRLLCAIRGKAPFDVSWDTPRIVVANDLLPSQVAAIDPSVVAGIAAERCGATGHAAILAGAKGIPMITGIAGLTGMVRKGDVAIIDGSRGELVIDPGEATIEAVSRTRIAEIVWERDEISAPVVTKDGCKIRLMANIGCPEEVQAALKRGAEGVGLFRTEFLFLGRNVPPSEDDHVAAYMAALAATSPHTVVIRTLDAGGDKEIPFLGNGREDNPFLGLRAIRLCLARQEVFRTQLRALLRSAPSGHLWAMFPMITDLSELVAAKALLEECACALEREGVPFAFPEKIGAMVEVPSSALLAHSLAKEASFLSVGTNDLTQYTLACDRGNSDVAHLSSPFHPAVLRLLAMIASAATSAGIPADVCGEMGGDPLATPLLLGMGFRELSMSAPRIPSVRKTIRSLDMSECAVLAEHVLTMTSRTEVESELRAFADRPSA
jgi:phosphotransferase system enzyme I (PtsI)